MTPLERSTSVIDGRLALVAIPREIHVGGHLVRAAEEDGLTLQLFDMESAYVGPLILRKVNWWLRGRRPSQLEGFSGQVVHRCREFGPRWVITTGIAPLSAAALDELGSLGITRINYLTDDPWNPAHRASWFLEALPRYDWVFTPRRSNMDDLEGLGCPNVAYLPFAYAPHVHFPEPDGTWKADRHWRPEILFVGGADRDRVPLIRHLLDADFRVALYGGYWDRFPETRLAARGHAEAADIRRVTRGAAVTLCLVRAANRDGHVMRSFEIAAMQGCMLVQETDEHRAIFGEDGRCAVYFSNPSEMVRRARWLLERPEERERLARTARAHVTTGANTYRDRLRSMIEIAGDGLPAAGLASDIRASPRGERGPTAAVAPLTDAALEKGTRAPPLAQS